MYYGPSQSKRSSSPTGLVIGLAIGGVVLVAIILSLISARLSSRPRSLSNAPAAFTRFVSDDKYFSCVYPSDWVFSAGSFDSQKDNPAYLPMPNAALDMKMDRAAFTNGDVRIEIMADNMPAMFQQMGRGGQPAPNKANQPAMDLKSMATMDRMAASMSVQDYKEGPEKLFGCPLGTASGVAFTASGIAGGREAGSTGAIHGYVATVLGAGETHVQVICISPESKWQKARPIFLRVIDSLSPGGR